MRIAVLACSLGLAACAGPQASGSYETNASYGSLFAAARDAVPAVGYTVTSASKADGLIVAHQGVVMGNGSTNGMTISVSDAGIRRLSVDFQAPPGTLALGGFDGNVTQYIAAVRRRVPDLRAAR